MVDIKALNDAITRAGVKKKALANALGITPNSLTRKLDGSVDFKVSEICIIRDFLRLSNEEVCKIFLISSVIINHMDDKETQLWRKNPEMT